MFLFLRGLPRVGKSTILRQSLLPHHKLVAGLMVQRLRDGEQICGYRAVPVNGDTLPTLEAPCPDTLDGVFLYKRKTIAGVLESAVLRAESYCKEDFCKLIILDEIGGFELSSPAFMASLDNILSLGKPCLGVVKSHKNLSHAASRLALPGDVLRRSEALHNRLEAEGRVLTVDSGNLTATTRAVDAFIANALAE